MNNTFLIRMSAIAAVSLVALVSTAAAGHLPPPLGAGEQPLSAGVHVLDLVSREQGRSGYKHLPRIAVTLPSGWFNYNGWAVNDGGALGLAFWDVNTVYPTGCRWQGKPMIDPGRTVGGLARVLATRPLRHASTPTAAELAGFRGKYLRWSVPSGIDFKRRCDQGYFESWKGRGWATDRWQQGPGQVDRLWILNLNGKRLVIDANYLPSATRKQHAELDHIVHSIKFLTGSPPRSTTSTSSARQPNRAWRRGTWNLTQYEPAHARFGSGVMNAYFLVPPKPRGFYRWAALLKVRTPNDTKVRLTCRLRLGGIRRPVYWYENIGGNEHVVAFLTPSPLRRSARATATCRTSARIDAVWTSHGPTADLDVPGRYPWSKLRRT
jgi:hypothetical protein